MQTLVAMDAILIAPRRGEGALHPAKGGDGTLGHSRVTTELNFKVLKKAFVGRFNKRVTYLRKEEEK